MIFKYRYVNFGTKFTKGEGIRKPEDRTLDPSQLFANEVAMDVGGECWGFDGCTLPVFDHHFFRPHQYASATIAVLDHAAAIRNAMGSQELVWLVAHREPDFDAFCAMYAARVLLTEEVPALNWQQTNAFDPDLTGVPKALRWMALLGAYASLVDNCHRLSCRKERALHSVLYAALHRCRDYGDEDSGATEFFDEVRRAMTAEQLNPLFDSVLENSRVFAPELAVLDREVLAYERDVHRARKSAVNLCTAKFSDYYDLALKTALDQRPPELSQKRSQTDGIYLRQPECILFKEWARLDTENSSMGEGFLFTAVAYAGRRSGALNQSDYFFSVDPERAAGRHLYDVWEHLERAEIQALANKPEVSGPLLQAEAEAQESGNTKARRGFEVRAGKNKAYFDDPWFDGSNYECTIIATPNRGTYIAEAGRLADLSDDPVTQLVVQCIEHGIYQGPVTVKDLAARSGLADVAYPKAGMHSTLDTMQQPERGFFRLSSVMLEEHLDLQWGAMRPQIATDLWRILNPSAGHSLPTDFAERQVFWRAGWIAVWSREGLSIAFKQSAHTRGRDLSELFAELIRFVHDANDFVESSQKSSERAAKRELGEQLICTSAKLTYELSLPDHQVLQSFLEETRLTEVVKTLRDVQTAVAADQQRSAIGEGTQKMVELQKKVEVLEIVIVSFYATELMKTFSEQMGLQGARALWVSFGGVAMVTWIVWHSMGRPRGLAKMVLALSLLWLAAFTAPFWVPGSWRKQDTTDKIYEYLKEHTPLEKP